MIEVGIHGNESSRWLPRDHPLSLRQRPQQREATLKAAAVPNEGHHVKPRIFEAESGAPIAGWGGAELVLVSAPLQARLGFVPQVTIIV